MLHINTRYRPTFAKLGLGSFEEIVAFFMGTESPGRTTVALRQQWLKVQGESDLPVFYKQYEYVPAAWKFFGRPSKARCEYRNYRVFRELGIACAEAVAWGERRDGLGRLRRAFLITRAIPEALTLIDFMARFCPKRSDNTARKLRMALLRQLAGMTQRIHQARFFHHDLVWRNILVTWLPEQEPKIWWIDCPRGRFVRWSLWRQRQRWKDLALLDKSASRFCSRGERVAFIKEYLGQRRLGATGHRLIHDTLSYGKRRWPPDE